MRGVGGWPPYCGREASHKRLLWHGKEFAFIPIVHGINGDFVFLFLFKAEQLNSQI